MTHVQVPQSKINAQLQDPGKGEHLWTVLTMHRAPESMIKALMAGGQPDSALLDHENVLSVEGPGCFKCEEPFSVRLAHRRCTGTMALMPQ